MSPLASAPVTSLSGVVQAPGDKSISHRALILGACAIGESALKGLSEGQDVMRTVAALRRLGAEIERGADGLWRIGGVGVGGFREPAGVLEMGNSGTAARLLMGLVASHPMTCFFAGDASLSRRPMARVAEPLEQMGARLIARSGCRLPLAVIGSAAPLPISYSLPAPSAQVKSAVLLAGLNTPGRTTVIEPEPTRDHTERLLRHFGATVSDGEAEDGARMATLEGQPELTGRPVRIPGDPSSAAFPAVAAACVGQGAITIEHVGTNPLRTGLFRCLAEMGADIDIANERLSDGEPVADVTVRSGPLEGLEVPPERAPSMIDEYPVLGVAAACAKGVTVMRGLSELRLKESDRLAAMARALTACGVEVEELEDGLEIKGCGGPPPGGAEIVSDGDHRIAMAFLVLGAAARAPVAIDDDAMIATSFPGFVEVMNGLGANISRPA